MLSQAQRNQLTCLATRHFEDGVSMAASVYKLVEERDGFEKAEEAMTYYVGVQKDLALALDNIEADAIQYQRSVEM